MKVALVGFYNSGKTTIFNAITGQSAETKPSITPSDNVHKGIIHVQDSRLNKISEILKPKKITPALIECIDPAGFIKGNTVHNNQILSIIKDADLFIYVLRGFERADVPYQFEDINPERDFKELEYEFLILDLDLVTKRIERMTEQRKKGQKINEREMEILKSFAKNLELSIPLRDRDIKEEELNEIRHLNFFSLKPILAIVNVNEKANQDEEYDSKFLTACGSLEMELAKFSEKERLDFFKEFGINKPLNIKLSQKIYETLNYITFFTTVSDELRAWSIKKGTKAWDAAGKIHSDIQKGFIKAEVISYEDFISLNGDLGLARQKGIIRFEGKDYEVKDGDIITFRFKV